MCQFVMQRFRTSLHGDLGCAIHAPPDGCPIAAMRREVDHVPSLLLAQAGQHSPGDMEQHKHIGAVDVTDFFRRGFFDSSQHANTCIVDQHVGPVKPA
jgi:hypothetical protein